MDDPVDTRPTATAPIAADNQSDELKAAIARFSKPEFQEEITRLYGEAKDRAIEARDQRLKNAATGKKTSE
ncbi:hypothetical protein ETAA8_14980 [Anatilimnocola aggregata]|uniref:Uncharacterized protein n=1 Tax=Anatilimnocola aggregata TaxID=2528021 RepID=A0A517Y855_9BACT|nr:hypothetical protein [Anatilimnocola aggregata]QDU26420.1 hypothetical protein ETAA8_14980 [Anatilimnocola aggregata]